MDKSVVDAVVASWTGGKSLSRKHCYFIRFAIVTGRLDRFPFRGLARLTVPESGSKSVRILEAAEKRNGSPKLLPQRLKSLRIKFYGKLSKGDSSR